MVIDTGVRFGGYFCDFDRNVSVGEPSDEAKQMHRLLHRATEAGIGAAKPGNTAEDLFLAQAKVLEEEGGVKQNALGRCGHGLGKSLTEWPSNKIGDNTVLKPGMVMTIEPAAIYGEGMLMVHEENLAITYNVRCYGYYQTRHFPGWLAELRQVSVNRISYKQR